MHLSGDGPFTKKCQAWLEARVGCSKAVLAELTGQPVEQFTRLIHFVTDRPGHDWRYELRSIILV